MTAASASATGRREAAAAPSPIRAGRFEWAWKWGYRELPAVGLGAEGTSGMATRDSHGMQKAVLGGGGDRS